MIFDLCHFNDLAVRRKATQIHAVFGQNFTVIIVDFIAMSVAFLNFFFLVDPHMLWKFCPEYMDKHPGEVFRRYLRYRSDPGMMWMTGWVVGFNSSCVHRESNHHCGQILQLQLHSKTETEERNLCVRAYRMASILPSMPL